jgi:signal transduction histidine kinase
VSKLAAAISKIRYNGVDVDAKLEKTSVEEVWLKAIYLVQERLNRERIKHRYVGTSLEGSYYVDWLREVFLNLILNSLDAFRNGSGPRQNRSITLVAQKESEAKEYHVFDYSDNAGGIVFGRLKVPDPIKKANPGMGPEQLIFQPKVTSKNRMGAGWGLYLVRQALRLHHGSIDLFANTREGCTFRIQIRKDLQDSNHDGGQRK